jgi:hypothetical protein
LPWTCPWFYQNKGINAGTPDDFWLDPFCSLFVFEIFYEAAVQGSGCGALRKGYASLSC